MDDLKKLDELLQALKTVKAELKRKDRISEKAGKMTTYNSTPRRFQNVYADLNWACMEYDMAKTRFARAFKGSFLDVSTDEKTYNPSSFHSYKF